MNTTSELAFLELCFLLMKSSLAHDIFRSAHNKDKLWKRPGTPEKVASKGLSRLQLVYLEVTHRK